MEKFLWYSLYYYSTFKKHQQQNAFGENAVTTFEISCLLEKQYFQLYN